MINAGLLCKEQIAIAIIILAALIAFISPNSQEIMGLQKNTSKWSKSLAWRESYLWFIFISALSFISFYYLSRVSEFLYFQF